MQEFMHLSNPVSSMGALGTPGTASAVLDPSATFLGMCSDMYKNGRNPGVRILQGRAVPGEHVRETMACALIVVVVIAACQTVKLWFM